MVDNAMIPSSAGYKKGDTSEDVEKLQAWLTRFGYLDSPILDEFGLSHEAAEPQPKRLGSFDQNTERALMKMQKLFGLESTGQLDEITLERIQQPRCGVPDAPMSPEATTTLASVVAKWNRNNIRWSLGKIASIIFREHIRSAIQTALKPWAEVTPLTFSEILPKLRPQIIVSFRDGGHPPCPLVFGSRELAHAFYPPPRGGTFAGHVHFNENFRWSLDPHPKTHPKRRPLFPEMTGGFDLASIACHELGHSLGLDHSDVYEAVMFPSFREGNIKRSLHEDDITSIQALYN